MTFVVPASAGENGTVPPQILVSSINMSLKNVLTCYERISYTASPPIPIHRSRHDGDPTHHYPQEQGEAEARTTEMTTIAEISAQGKLRHGGVTARNLGKKMEKYSMDR